MATPTYTAIASITLGSSASSVEFSSIPQDYRDLVLAVFGKTTSGSNGFESRLNNDSGTNYNRVQMLATTSASSGANSNQNAMESFILATDTNGAFAHMQIMDYSATDKHKTVLVRSNDADFIVMAIAYRWADTAAVNSVLFQGNDGESFGSGSTFALYGIAS